MCQYLSISYHNVWIKDQSKSWETQSFSCYNFSCLDFFTETKAFALGDLILLSAVLISWLCCSSISFSLSSSRRFLGLGMKEPFRSCSFSCFLLCSFLHSFSSIILPLCYLMCIGIHVVLFNNIRRTNNTAFTLR